MNALRSIIFNIFFIGGSLFLSIVLFWTWFLPQRQCTVLVSFFYGGYIAMIQRWILGLKTKIIGLENLPAGNRFIIAAKHQSAAETLLIPFTRAWHYPVIILKKELIYLPFWGMYPLRMGLVAINRKAGTKALSEMIAGCKRALDQGRSIAIFPQGTRVKPGVSIPYKGGIAKIYRDLNVPIVPLALNTGVFWGKNAFFKKSGTVTYEFLPAIPAGLPPLQMMEQLEKALEQGSDKLVTAAGGPAITPAIKKEID